MLVLQLLTVQSTLVVLQSRMIIMKTIGHACINNCGIHFLETLVIIPARQNQFIKNTFFNKAPLRRACAMKKKSALTRLYSEKLFWYQKFDCRYFMLLTCSLPIVETYAADICRLYVATLKTMKFQD